MAIYFHGVQPGKWFGYGTRTYWLLGCDSPGGGPVRQSGATLQPAFQTGKDPGVFAID